MLLMIEWSGIILCMQPANERRRYNVTSSLIGWVHTQNDKGRAYIRLIEFPKNIPYIALMDGICDN